MLEGNVEVTQAIFLWGGGGQLEYHLDIGGEEGGLLKISKNGGLSTFFYA